MRLIGVVRRSAVRKWERVCRSRRKVRGRVRSVPGWPLTKCLPLFACETVRMRIGWQPRRSSQEVRPMKTMEKSLYRIVLVVAAMGLVAASAQRMLADGASNNFTQTNLVSDIPGVAVTTDPNLVNPWGVSFAPTSPFWVSDNHTGVATLYNGAGSIIPLVVTVPPPTRGVPPSAPTGQVFNGNSGDFGGSHFIFATEDGTIAAWTSGMAAALMADNSASGAVYKGLAIGTISGTSFLYATN